MARVVVVGAGVIGSTTAATLLEAGHDVEVWHRDDHADTTSAVAAAIWYPYLAEPRTRVLAWSRATHERLLELARDAATGVLLQDVVELFAVPEPDLSWLPSTVALERIAPEPFGARYRSAVRMQLPICDTVTYLPWLRARIAELGGRFERRAVTDLSAPLAAAELVVNCAGLGARELCADPALVGVRGQVVHAERVDLPFALIDDTDPEQPVYVLPRNGDIVLGGSARRGDERIAEDPEETAAIREACGRRVPAVRDAATIRARAGLRPFRAEVRLEPEPGEPRLCHNYGHGGSGFTMAWGCAAEVSAWAKTVR